MASNVDFETPVLALDRYGSSLAPVWWQTGSYSGNSLQYAGGLQEQKVLDYPGGFDPLLGNWGSTLGFSIQVLKFIHDTNGQPLERCQGISP
ncbi:hypothetical protein DSO57_1019251 [Entomophthora muscae]|uniref:Uncharacterized protein n=1 Tax=Entomophthora muscae TaxID=34485 RepID=A0ACC2UDE3_9FUNG|nr:hypothetical protein DSO57_1019251 [Entomophthora muscae]